MSNTAILKEFLVKLGFEQDERALKKFTDGVTGATKNVVKLVAAIQGAALTIGAGVAAFASNLERMYFASIKAGSSAKNLQAFGKAAQNFGAQSEEALQSVQSLARFMRETPGSEGFLKSLGVNTRDVNGKLRDTTDIMVDLGKQLQDKPYTLSKQYGDILGISEDTLRAMLNGDFAREVEKQRAILKDSGFDKAAESSHKFMMQLRELQTFLQIFAVQVQEALVNKLGISMEQMGSWVRDNMPMIASRTADVLMMLLTLAEKLGPAIVWLVDKFIAADKATNGWSTKLIALVAVFTALGGPALVAGIWALAGAFGALSLPILAIAAAGVAGWKIGQWVNSKIYGEGWDDPAKSGSGGNIGSAQSSGGKIKRAAGAESKRLADLEQKYGLPPGLLDSVWNAESGRGKNMRSSAGAQGHFQFMPETAKQYGLSNPDDFDQSSEAAARYYRDLMKKYNGNVEKAVAAYNWGPGNVDSKGMSRAPAETRGYVAKVTAGMGGGVQVAQNTTINVNGGDALATGRAVASEQERVNATLTRNLQVAYN